MTPPPLPSLVLPVVLIVALLMTPAPAGTVPAGTGPESTGPEGQWPLDPRPEVVTPFDPPTEPWDAGHRGIDLAGHPGQAVRTALAGTVSFAGAIAGKPVVTVTHGALRTTYEPVVATVSVGDTVAGGQVVGRLTVLHGHCFPAACLHWGLRRGDTYLDPLSLVGGGGVRLLPLWRDDPASVAPRQWQSPLSQWRSPLTLRRPPLDALP